MDAFRKTCRLRTEDGLPSNYRKTQTGGWTCENEFYRFPINESPKDPWERCYEVVDKADEELYKELKDEISGLLIVASLFLGIVTAFSTMSFGWLRVDDKKVSAALLGDIVKLLNDTDARGTVPPRSVTTFEFNPRHSEVVVNQMWFLSMTLSLSAVMVGTLCLQWLSTFRRKELKQRAYDDALALRQLRFEGLLGWGVPYVPGFLLLTVQGAFVLFATGLMYLLWSVNKQVAIPVVIVGGVVALLLIITTVMPLLQSVIGWMFPSTLIIPQCPYKSPISWVLHRGCVLLSIVVTLPFSLLPRFGKVLKWRSQQVKLLTDYTWQLFDDVWRGQRERWGPQTSKTGSRKYSYYLVHGLASAMEILVFQPNAVHIIHTCLQGFHGTSAEEETFEHLFGKSTSVVKQALSEYKAIVSGVVDEKSQPRLSVSYKENLRRDFLNAHALQHFVTHNPKLHRALLPHRVELYIRIKNSSRHLGTLKGLGGNYLTSAEKQYIGTSIKCPIRDTRDADALSAVFRVELRYQFLKFADWFLDTDWCDELDVCGVESVLNAVKKMRIVSGADVDEPPLEESMKKVLKLVDKHFTEISHHRRLSSAGTATVYETGGENVASPEHEEAHGSPWISKGAGDKELSSTIPLTPVLVDLHEIVQGKLDRKKRNEAKLDSDYDNYLPV
ncbi:hypothetical protein AGABI1DRAFT_108413 [Agaricus bisporus var. burnettii JB137-S8]|uniref:DUF6535 domain-containing protein n=1 Tax=Agaricus bisporus var. burnettii (strain JB137-S8 / ATCC MYA-4627 / FGSC 10392) TaxID=597362 RepID=K5X1M1_AGABU|nr:uncharacterized protein AGABI1DRAFT_108413 [Agaricus bisporus var. burnettii JB137-S8]EKM77038.1 hypothetical protein AGABI1DRAFT_108413 [Agaricus bisporus var. burnettii JB137-S8]